MFGMIVIVIKRIGIVILAILAGIVGGIALAVLLTKLKEARNGTFYV